jgi:hypothetical protein
MPYAQTSAHRPIEFWEFCPKVLKLDLTPGQRVVAKVSFGNYDPADLEGEERDLALQMFGGVERVEPSARKFILLRLGRGSGKTTLCSAYAIYESVTHDISKCGPGDVPYMIVVAPDKETAKLSIRMCREMIRAQPALERLIVTDNDQMVQLRRPDGRMVRIESFAASRGGSAMRGRTIIGFLMDEAEFFTSNADGKDYAVNDRDIFRALKPRLLRNGKGMLISTPWPVETLMGEMFEENWGRPKTALAVKAPTSLVRGNDPDIMAMIEDEMAKDPENARRELFCELDGISGGEFFDVNALATSLDNVYEFPQPFNPKWPVAIGCDFGFTRDSSAIVVVQYDGTHYRMVYADELRPKPGKPLKPSEVVEKFAMVAKQYGVSGVIADGYYREAIKEALQQYNLGLFDAPEGTRGKAEVFQRTRSCLHEGRLRIPDIQIGRRMVQQCKLVTSKPAPGGTTTIKIPRKIGLGHGDIVSAWTLAVHRLAYDQVRADKTEYEPGTPEWNAEFTRRLLTREEKALKKSLEQAEREVRMRMSGKRRREFQA